MEDIISVEIEYSESETWCELRIADNNIGLYIEENLKYNRRSFRQYIMDG